jgi:hypothetical protein
VVQPVLDLFGDNPTAFRFRDVEGLQIALYAVAVVVVPPLVLWLVGQGVSRIDRRAGRYVHLASVAILFGLIGVLLSKELTGSAVVGVVTAVALAVAGTLAYLRFDGAYLWLRLLSVANLLFLAQFLFMAPVADWITNDTQTAAEVSFADEVTDEQGRPPSLVMVVLDELATQSVIGDDDEIDAVRFPNLAGFAQDATWYRHFSTVSPFTQSAVPALLDGQDPHGEPVWTDHPDNLFSLLANSHHLTVSESLTKLCGFEICAGEPQPPPDSGASDAPTSSSPQWGALVDETADVWLERVTPGASESAESFADFAEDVRPAEADGADRDGNGEVIPIDEDQLLDGYFATGIEAQPSRLDAFVDALRPTDEPFFAYLHLLLPHQPWLAREDGTRYDVPGDDEEPDVSADWRARVTRQRQFLQAEYTDRLLGVVLDRLKETGEYDDTLIVVVSDHGVSFEPGESTRSLSAENVEEVAYSPLLVKAPGQDLGRVDDTNLLSVDLPPTIADLLGTELYWDLDGVRADEADALRGDDKYIYSYTDAFTYEFLGIEEFGDEVGYQVMADGRFPTVAADESRLSALYEGRPGADLIGRPAAGILRPDGGEARVRELDALRQPAKAELLAEVAGAVPDADPTDSVIVAVNGTVVGVSPLYEDATAANQFVVLLPAGAMQPDGNEIQVGLLNADGSQAAELDLVAID